MGVVPKRSKRIAAQIALAGPCHTVTRAQRNLIRKLGLAPEEGLVPAQALADFDALFNEPLCHDRIIALSVLFSNSLPPAQAAEMLSAYG